MLLIYAVLVLLFEGFLPPFSIMMSLPLALGGALAAGEEVVGTSYSAYRGALQDQLVGRRKLEHQEVSCSVNVASCEFSLPTLMRKSYVLQKLARSGDMFGVN